MSETEVKTMMVDQAEAVLREAIDRMPEEVIGWPKHVLDQGSDEDKIELATLLQRGDA